MKRVKELAIMILMITIIGMLSIKVEASTGKINSETVRLRKEPNTNSTILEQLNQDDEVEILEQEDGWYKVQVQVNGETITGYVSEKLVDVKDGDVSSTTTSNNTTNANTTTSNQSNIEQELDIMPEIDTEIPVEPQEVDIEPTTETVDTSTEIKEDEQYNLEKETEIKALPLINSKTKATISGNVKIVEIINDWCRIENDVEIGWIRINSLKKSTTSEVQPQESPAETTPNDTANIDDSDEKTTETTPTITNLNKTGYVNAEGLIVREEPSTSSKEIDSLSKNDKVEITGETEGWYQIKLNSKTGYVSSKYISDTKAAETTSRSGSSIKAENITPMEEQEETQSQSQDTSSSGTTGTEVVEYAKQYLGYKYVSGGASPSTGFDCSGFTSYVYNHFGITLNRSSKDQIKNGVAVDRSNLQPGDIVVFNNSANTAIGHVGIYIGGDNFIHAANPSEGVRITSLSSSYYKIRYVGARRVI